MSRDRTWSLPLLDWQEQATTWFHQLTDNRHRTFTAYVTPSGGKTIFALRVAHDVLNEGVCQFVVVVVHTDNLRSQWIKQAALRGLRLAADLDESQDGLVLTYHQ